jgi:nucleolin
MSTSSLLHHKKRKKSKKEKQPTKDTITKNTHEIGDKDNTLNKLLMMGGIEDVDDGNNDREGNKDNHNHNDDFMANKTSIAKPTGTNTNDHEQEQEDATTATTTGKRKRKRKRKSKNAMTTEIEEGIADSVENSNHENPNISLGTFHQQQDDVVTNTVFVEGISFDASCDDVQQFFCQQLQPDDIVEMRLPTFQDSGRLRGFGHVQLATPVAYQTALSMSGKHLGTRYLTIQPAKEVGLSRRSVPQPLPLPPPDRCRTLFVQNLPYGATESDIATAFGQVVATNQDVDVTDGQVRIVRNSVTRQSKGFAYVDFSSADQLQIFVQSIATRHQQNPKQQHQPLMVGGRTVRLDYDTGRIKGSFRTDSGRLWSKENKGQQQQQQQQRRPRN